MKITSVNYNCYKSGGCSTCDYGAIYVDEISIYLEDGVSLIFNSETDDCVMSESDWMILLCNASSIDDIIDSWKEKFKSDVKYGNKDIYYEVCYSKDSESVKHYLTEKDYDE